MDSITTGLASSTIGGGHKKTIHQNIPSNCVKKGPYTIVRAADLNDGIEILRRFGEGLKPLFARDDISANQATIGDKHGDAGHASISSAGCKSTTNICTFSTESGSSERYRHRDIKKHSSSPPTRRKSSESSTLNERYTYNSDKHSHSATKTDRFKRKNNGKSRSPFPEKKWPTEKASYISDKARERYRLRLLYGNRDRGRSRSRTPPSSNKYSPVFKHRIDSSKRRRSTSRDKYHRRSPYRSSGRDGRSCKSLSRSCTRSPQRRERVSHKHRSRSSRERDERYDSATVITPTPQFIPIPVRVPAEYAYSLSGWPTLQPTWPPLQHLPPLAHYPPFHMVPIMPPIRPPHPAVYYGLPPNLAYTSPYRTHCLQMFIPQRHSLNRNQPRSKNTSK